MTSTNMRLKSVCVGRSKSVRIRGHDVKTAYQKAAVTTPVEIFQNGVEGNDVAVHLDAIYAIAEENYDHWGGALGVDRQSWPPGTFAENLTISGLDESNLLVGDVFAVGEDVVLSVAGPRVPCFKLCWRLQQPDSFIPEFATSGKSGVYFNVDKPGHIQSGDEVRLIHGAENSVKTLDIARFLFGTPAREDELRFIMSLPGLSKSALFALESKIFHTQDQQRAGQNRWKGLREVKVDRVVDETPDIKSFTLIPTDGKPLAPFKAGQFLTVKLPIDGGTPMKIWSLSDYHETPESYRLSIKKERLGAGSGFMHGEIKSGATLDIAAPLGRFSLDRGSFKPILFLAASIGITPLLSMLKAHTSRGEDMPPAYLVHCNRNGALQPFREELDALAMTPNVSILHVFSKPSKEDESARNFDVSGRLTFDVIEDFIGDAHIMDGDLRIDMPLFEFDFYVCGPESFQADMINGLISAGANQHQIFQESFQSGESDQQLGTIAGAEVVFSKPDVTVTWDAGENVTLLELAEAAGLSPDNACRMGVCQSCSQELLEGEVYYEMRPTHYPEDNQVLLCCARPASRRVVLSG